MAFAGIKVIFHGVKFHHCKGSSQPTPTGGSTSGAALSTRWVLQTIQTHGKLSVLNNSLVRSSLKRAALAKPAPRLHWWRPNTGPNLRMLT
eukprot:411982-Amphidinium_carterae.1